MIKEIRIEKIDSPVFEGKSFGSVGQYESLKGVMKGEVDPQNPLNACIVNIDKASKNSQGFVEYEVDLFIIKPVDVAKGNRRIFYEILNRGNKLALGMFNNIPPGGEPGVLKNPGNGFLMNQGYTMVWSGWQVDYPIDSASPVSVSLGSRFPAGDGRMFARFPIAKNSDGTSITGKCWEEFIDDTNSNPFTGYLTYPAADHDPSGATLTVRDKEKDEKQTPEGMSWRYIDEWRVEITRPKSADFESGAIFEFIYEAKDPVVYGLAFASMRDAISFLRYDEYDANGNPNPLAPEGKSVIEKAISFGASQCGRALQNFLYEGFNQDEKGRIVFDGANIHIGGSRKLWCNFEFAKPGPSSTQHNFHLQVNDQFPFTFKRLYDPISKKEDSYLERCIATNTCPKIIHTDTDTELWEGRASLIYTDTEGNDIDLPENVRAYLFAACQHTPGSPTIKGLCQQLQNPLDYKPLSRALLVALDEWITSGKNPPESLHPKRSDGTLVKPDQSETGFPEIPGVTYQGLHNELSLVDYDFVPPKEGELYPVFVSKVDADGNGVAGIRLPDVEVPTATYTGWNLRAAGYSENELGLGGYYIPFPKTKEERLSNSDPRLSIEERYPDHESYVEAIRQVVDRLLRDRFLIEEDAQLIIKRAMESEIGK